MKRSAKIILFALLFIVLVSSPVKADETDAAEDDRLSNLIKKIKPSIVAVGTYYFNDLPKAAYLGTGFAIDGGKRIVTNYHVILPIIEKKKTSYLRIFHADFPDTGIKAGIAATDEVHDLAILEHESNPLPVLKIGDSSSVKEGYGVIFTGYPIGLVLGLNPTTHSGMISGIAPLVKPSPSARIIDGDLIRHLSVPYNIFQIDGTAFPGNSGSPVILRSSGEVIGVINMVFIRGKKEHALSDPTGITYAIPSDFIQALKKTIP
ncbi:MAG: serine protease [Desulfobacula sp.]|jgi:S1-C subfamily serine protease